MNAIELCTKFEKILRPMGWHVGLTGSCLYGQIDKESTGKDIDIIIYPHVKEDGSRPYQDEPKIGKALGFVEFECTESDEYDCSEDYIWIGKLPCGQRVDCFFLS